MQNSPLFLVTSALAACFLATNVIAQGTPSTSRGTIEEVIVTAERRAESIQSVPVAVTALGSESIESNHLGNILDIGRLVPNVVIVNGTGPANSSRLFFRGIGEDDSRNPDPAVGTYLDGIFVGRSIGALLEIADVEQIEVLRGPQGTLYGRNSNGGAIKVVSVKPQDENTLSLSGGVGSDGRLLVKGVGNYAFSSNTALRVSGLHRQRDAFHQLTPNGGLAGNAREVGDQDISLFRGSLRHHFSDSWTATATLDYTKDKSEPVPSSLLAESDDASIVTDADQNIFTIEPAPGTTCVAAAPAVPATETTPEVPAVSASTDIGCFSNFFSDVEVFGAAVNIEGKIGNFDFVSLTGYRTLEDELSAHISLPYTQMTDQTQISQELTFSSNFEGSFNFLTGLYYFNEDVDFASVFAFLHVSKTETESLGVFIQGAYEFSDKLALVGGLRYTDETRDFSGVSLPFPGFNNSGSVEIDNTTYTVKLEYQATDDVFVYLSAASGFKTPGFSSDCFTPPSCFRPVDEEEVVTYEIGLRSDLFNDHVRFNATYFYSDYTDLQVNATVPASLGGGFSRSNAANALIDGLELEAIYRPIANLEIFANLGLLNSEYDNLTIEQAAVLTTSGLSCPLGVVTIACAEGLKLKNAPEYQANLGFLWRIAAGAGEVSVGGDVTWEDESYALGANGAGALIEPPARVNARIAFKPNSSRWNVALWAKNLTDEEYYKATVGDNGVYASAPLTWGLDFGIDF